MSHRKCVWQFIQLAKVVEDGKEIDEATWRKWIYE